jgi:hypothetical protein
MKAEMVCGDHLTRDKTGAKQPWTNIKMTSSFIKDCSDMSEMGLDCWGSALQVPSLYLIQGSLTRQAAQHNTR